jgi:hypothetical protein
MKLIFFSENLDCNNIATMFAIRKNTKYFFIQPYKSLSQKN